jgi:hypothetical protein
MDAPIVVSVSCSSGKSTSSVRRAFPQARANHRAGPDMEVFIAGEATNGVPAPNVAGAVSCVGALRQECNVLDLTR